MWPVGHANCAQCGVIYSLGGRMVRRENLKADALTLVCFRANPLSRDPGTLLRNKGPLH